MLYLDQSLANPGNSVLQIITTTSMIFKMDPNWFKIRDKRLYIYANVQGISVLLS